MLKMLFGKQDVLTFERSFPAPVDAVWHAITDADAVRQWWGPNKTTVPECEIEPAVGGRIRIVMEATEAMGKYAGTRWPMEGTVTEVDQPHRFAYDARSWVEEQPDTTTIEHVNELVLTSTGDGTALQLTITISEIGSGAKLAAMGMKYGYKQYLDKLETHLAG